jgi:hypothetical protein
MFQLFAAPTRVKGGLTVSHASRRVVRTVFIALIVNWTYVTGIALLTVVKLIRISIAEVP